MRERRRRRRRRRKVETGRCIIAPSGELTPHTPQQFAHADFFFQHLSLRP